MAFVDLTWRTFRPAEGYYTSEVRSPRPLPVRTFLPVGYEPRYPYPLLIFLHGHGGNEEQILNLAPRLSRRNYISIGLRGPLALGRRKGGEFGYSWGDGASTSLIEEYLLRAIEQTRLNYHIHSERIYLAGFAEGATLAYRLALTFPEKLGGIISFSGAMPRHDRPLFRYPALRTLRVFIAHGIADPVVPLSLAKEDHRLLYTAGVQVEMHTYPTTHKLHPYMLRDVNRWVIQRCSEE
ncbi:MAG: dienelactone hydrolase family protein [Planctomycetes bacterium]|nr:dienelactone hydrolase family protein [Planctomycetota bacterium]